MLKSENRPSVRVDLIEYGSDAYVAGCELRRRFLREPLGLELTDEDTAGEEAQVHVGLFETTSAPPRLIGTAIGNPASDLDRGSIRVRQVVVDAEYRGLGLGALMMDQLERLLSERGFHRFILFARQEAAPFYERCGYEATGETKELIGREHLRMEKVR